MEDTKLLLHMNNKKYGGYSLKLEGQMTYPMYIGSFWGIRGFWDYIKSYFTHHTILQIPKEGNDLIENGKYYNISFGYKGTSKDNFFIDELTIQRS